MGETRETRPEESFGIDQLADVGWPRIVYDRRPDPGWQVDPGTTVVLVVGDSYAINNGLVCIECRVSVASLHPDRLGKDEQRLVRYYLDPERDYICRRRDRQDTRAFTRDVTAFGRTPEGGFFPAETELRYARPGRGPTETKRFLLDTEPVFPDDVFDIKRVLDRYKTRQRPGPGASGMDEALASRSLARITGTVVASDTGEPLQAALVRVAVPRADMLRVRGVDRQGRTFYETRTDGSGKFAVEIPAAAKSTTYYSMDVFARGYGSAAGGLNGILGHVSGTASGIRAGRIRSIPIRLGRAKYVAGTVLDEDGVALEGVEVSRSGGRAAAVTDARGRFELFDFALDPDAERPGRWSRVTFTHPLMLPSKIDSIYELSDEEMAAVSIRMRRGVAVSGTLLDTRGEPMAKAPVLAFRTPGPNEKPTSRALRRSLTDSAGRFVLGGLEAQPITVRSHVPLAEQKVERQLGTISADRQIELHMLPAPLPEGTKTIQMLGMQLADLTPQLGRLYNLPYPDGVVVIHPGLDNPRFPRPPPPGFCFRRVGRTHVRNTTEMAAALLRASGPAWGLRQIRLASNEVTIQASDASALQALIGPAAP